MAECDDINDKILFKAQIEHQNATSENAVNALLNLVEARIGEILKVDPAGGCRVERGALPVECTKGASPGGVGGGGVVVEPGMVGVGEVDVPSGTGGRTTFVGRGMAESPGQVHKPNIPLPSSEAVEKRTVAPSTPLGEAEDRVPNNQGEPEGSVETAPESEPAPADIEAFFRQLRDGGRTRRRAQALATPLSTEPSASGLNQASKAPSPKGKEKALHVSQDSDNIVETLSKPETPPNANDDENKPLSTPVDITWMLGARVKPLKRGQEIPARPEPPKPETQRFENRGTTTLATRLQALSSPATPPMESVSGPSQILETPCLKGEEKTSGVSEDLQAAVEVLPGPDAQANTNDRGSREVFASTSKGTKGKRYKSTKKLPRKLGQAQQRTQLSTEPPAERISRADPPPAGPPAEHIISRHLTPADLLVERTLRLDIRATEPEAPSNSSAAETPRDTNTESCFPQNLPEQDAPPSPQPASAETDGFGWDGYETSVCEARMTPRSGTSTPRAELEDITELNRRVVREEVNLVIRGIFGTLMEHMTRMPFESY